MKSYKLILLSILISVTLFSQGEHSNVAKWKFYPIPTNEDTLMKYNGSQLNWRIQKKRNNIYATPLPNFFRGEKLPFKLKPLTIIEKREFDTISTISYVEIIDGYLVSFYQGEFGGSLYWFDRNGEKRKRVARTMIVQFIKRNNKLYAIGGLQHEGLLYGGIVELRKENDDWKLFDYVNLHDAPYAIDINKKNQFIVITSNHLFSVDENKNIDTLVANGYWNMLYPTSMVINENQVLVGMRQGIFKFDFITKKEEWLMQD